MAGYIDSRILLHPTVRIKSFLLSSLNITPAKMLKGRFGKINPVFQEIANLRCPEAIYKIKLPDFKKNVVP
jgi:hypothetical protein